MPEATASQPPKPRNETEMGVSKNGGERGIFAASVFMKKEAETRVLPAHVENGGDTSGTRWFPDAARLPPFSARLGCP
jgi:hypothetical protein